MKQRLGFYIILYAAGLHIGWALILLCDLGIKLDTPTSAFLWFSSSTSPAFVAAVLIAVSIIAAIGESRWYGELGLLLLCIIPQQALLMLSAAASINAVINGQYADGYIAPWNFILKDQFSNIWAMALHTFFVATVFAAWKKERRNEVAKDSPTGRTRAALPRPNPRRRN